MDLSSTVATWLSFAATAAGLGGLISQANAINDKMDPFHAYRSFEYLGIWYKRQKALPAWAPAKPPLEGPVLEANLSAAFCGKNLIHVTRMPLKDMGAPERPAGLSTWPFVTLTGLCLMKPTTCFRWMSRRKPSITRVQAR